MFITSMLLVLLACCSYHLTTPTCYIHPDFKAMCVTALLCAYWLIVDLLLPPLYDALRCALDTIEEDALFHTSALGEEAAREGRAVAAAAHAQRSAPAHVI